MGKIIMFTKDMRGIKMATTIFDVAEYFLSKETMTHKKLQKLCYYGQSWSLALLDIPLINEEFQAWIHGPVCPELYARYKDNRWKPINKNNSTKFNVSTAQMKVLDEVWDMYGEFDGDDLEVLTHMEEPWIKAREGRSEYEPSTNIISKDMMKNFYRDMYEQLQGE